MAVVLGLGIGALVCYDFLIANYLHWQIGQVYFLRRLPIPALQQVAIPQQIPTSIPSGGILGIASYGVPYIFTGIMTVLVISLGIFAITFPKLWEHRFKILLILVVASHQTWALLRLGKVDGARLFTLLFLLVWLLHLLMNEGEPIALSPTFFLALGLIGAMLLSTVNGGFPSLQVLVVRDLKNLVLFLLLSHFLQRRQMLWYFIKVLIVVTAVSGVIGLLQEALYMSSGTLLLGQVDQSTIALMFTHSSSGGLILRVPAFMGSPEDFGILLAVVSSIVFYLLLTPSIRLFKHRSFLYVMLVLLLAPLGLTFSRGAMLGCATGLILALYLRWPSHSIQLTAALASLLVVVAIVAFVKPASVRKAVEVIPAELSYGSVRVRSELAEESLEGTMQRHPFIGVGDGLGNRYTTSHFGWPAHNAFIQALAETGLVGFVMFAAVFSFVLVRLLATILIAGGGETRALGHLLLAGFAALLFHVQWDPFFHLDLIWISWGMIEGLTTAFLRRRWFRTAPIRTRAFGASRSLLK